MIMDLKKELTEFLTWYSNQNKIENKHFSKDWLDEYEEAFPKKFSREYNWVDFDKTKPHKDELFLITNGGFVEICYFEDGEFMKPFRFDEYDSPTFNSKDSGLKWQKIKLLTPIKKSY
jgi:hypothetical protein